MLSISIQYSRIKRFQTPGYHFQNCIAERKIFCHIGPHTDDKIFIKRHKLIILGNMQILSLSGCSRYHCPTMKNIWSDLRNIKLKLKYKQLESRQLHVSSELSYQKKVGKRGKYYELTSKKQGREHERLHAKANYDTVKNLKAGKYENIFIGREGEFCSL